MKIKYDRKNKFKAMFDPGTGFYMRSGVLENGKDTGVDAFMTEFPELLDVGIMGHCVHGERGLCVKAGIGCYQDGLNVKHPNMSLENFRRIAAECRGKTFQMALGGRGDVDMHESFEEILRCCRENDIVPNFTSSGLCFTEKTVELCRKYCGAVAISWYRQEHTLRAIDMLLKAGVKTNIHYVLSNSTIDEAITRLENEDFPQGVNAVIFLLHKPVGLGSEKDVLDIDDSRVQRFYCLINEREFPFKLGFDSCAAPALINLSGDFDRSLFDTCEGARWSAYITSDMKLLPCSFDNIEQRWAYDISNSSIAEGWQSPQFEDFRSRLRNSCIGCRDRAACMGGCPIRRDIVLCNRKEKEQL